ncbi:hypothetical protein TSMEX_005774 [Taenia solium]|eukprot:TsM_000916500 transcript=TsM_000916500 gene=TsM_000916500
MVVLRPVDEVKEWRQQSRPGAGYSVYGLCESSSTTERDEFWLFGPLIPVGRALSVHVQVNFMLRSCADREIVDGRGGTCRENFDVFLQQEALRSDMDVADVPHTDVVVINLVNVPTNRDCQGTCRVSQLSQGWK